MKAFLPALVAILAIGTAESSPFESIAGRYQGFFEFNQGEDILLFDVKSLRISRTGRISGLATREILPPIEFPDDSLFDENTPEDELVREGGDEEVIVTKLKVRGRMRRVQVKGKPETTTASAIIRLSDRTVIRGKFMSRRAGLNTPSFVGSAKVRGSKPTRVDLFKANAQKNR